MSLRSSFVPVQFLSWMWKLFKFILEHCDVSQWCHFCCYLLVCCNTIHYILHGLGDLIQMEDIFRGEASYYILMKAYADFSFLWKSVREANCENRPLWDPWVVSLSHWVVSYIDMLLCPLISWHAWYLFISMHNYPSQSVMPDFVWRRLIKCRLITSLWFLFSSPVRGVGSAGNVPQPGMTQNRDLSDLLEYIFVKIRVLTC